MYLMFGIFDVKGESFGVPFFKAAKAQAVRDFKVLCNDPTSMPGKFPDDFKLFFLGEFDEGSGVIRGEGPVVVCNGPDVVDAVISELKRRA